jgi:Fe2+ transport system protein B
MSDLESNSSQPVQPVEEKDRTGEDKNLIEAETDALTGKDATANALVTELDAHDRYRLATLKFEADIEKLNVEVSALKIANEASQRRSLESGETHNLRKEYTDKLFGLILWWLIVVVTFILLSATAKPAFNLSDTVLVAFITSTTVSVLGLFVLVAKWLFPSSQKDDENKKND